MIAVARVGTLPPADKCGQRLSDSTAVANARCASIASLVSQQHKWSKPQLYETPWNVTLNLPARGADC